jgi:hypothetical protein
MSMKVNEKQATIARSDRGLQHLSKSQASYVRCCRYEAATLTINVIVCTRPPLAANIVMGTV